MEEFFGNLFKKNNINQNQKKSDKTMQNVKNWDLRIQK